MTAVWRRIRSELASATDRDFERAAIPLLRILWPDIITMPARKTWDAKGIDLAVWPVADEVFPCVIQCKGFEVLTLSRDQARQCLHSVRKFAASGLKTKHYILLHNRSNKPSDFTDDILRELGGLVSSNAADVAELWDTETLLKRVTEMLRQQIDEHLQILSRTALESHKKLFEFGPAFIDAVPVTEHRLRPHRTRPSELTLEQSSDKADILNVLDQASAVRWTLLTGGFGSGKTSSVLHFAASTSRRVIWIPCGQMDLASTGNATNSFWRQVLDTTGFLDEHLNEDRDLVGRLAAPLFGQFVLSEPDDYMVILDGLDENRRFARLKGIKELTNQLSELRCPVILTTRLEHFRESYGTFDSAFDSLSDKGGSKRDIRIIVLDPWTEVHIGMYLDAQMSQSGDTGQVQSLRDLVLTGSHNSYYGDLLSTPLFLAFVVDDVRSQGVRHVNRTTLIEGWIWRKISRDLNATHRHVLDPTMDVNEYIGHMMALLEETAGIMVSPDKAGFTLTECILAATVRQLAEPIFRVPVESVLPVLLTSVLTPIAERRGTDLPVAFALRILHEYFLARHLVSHSLDDGPYPANVRTLCQELRVAREQ